MKTAIDLKINAINTSYSVRSAVTGSLLEALPAGISPERSVRKTLRAIRSTAARGGSEALTAVRPVIW